MSALTLKIKIRMHIPTYQTTSAVCKAAQVTRGQLRVYEDAGLITVKQRTAAGYRQYGSDTLDRLKAILQLKELGLTLAEIGLLLSKRDGGTLDALAIQKQAGDALQKIDLRIAGLLAVRDHVAPVARGDFSTLEDDDCKFLVHFMSAMS